MGDFRVVQIDTLDGTTAKLESRIICFLTNFYDSKVEKRTPNSFSLITRYGMTETGMLLSNEYDSDRAPGFIGLPLPGVSAKLASEEKKTVMECTNVDGQLKFQMKPQETVSGELLVRGDGIFKEYYNRPQATAKEFQDGWFITGDMCEYDIDNGKFKMLGRKSADIIKSGGYKISALQIETEILAHKDVKECMVAGVEDEAWGEKICAVLVARDGENELNVNSITEFLAEKLPKYAQPKIYKVVKELPKNAMGKINKKQVLKSIFSWYFQDCQVLIIFFCAFKLNE